MKNALTILLCTIVLGCIGGRSVSTSVQNAKLLKPIKLENSGLVVRPIALNQPTSKPIASKPAEVKPIRTTPVAPTLESVPATVVPKSPIVEPASPPLVLQPIDIKPIDITPIETTEGVLLPELEVEQIELKEIEIPKPIHIKIFQLLLFYGVAGLLIWLAFLRKNKRATVKAPVKRKRKTRKKKS